MSFVELQSNIAALVNRPDRKNVASRSVPT